MFSFTRIDTKEGRSFNFVLAAMDTMLLYRAKPNKLNSNNIASRER